MAPATVCCYPSTALRADSDVLSTGTGQWGSHWRSCSAIASVVSSLTREFALSDQSLAHPRSHLVNLRFGRGCGVQPGINPEFQARDTQGIRELFTEVSRMRGFLNTERAKWWYVRFRLRIISRVLRPASVCTNMFVARNTSSTFGRLRGHAICLSVFFRLTIELFSSCIAFHFVREFCVFPSFMLTRRFRPQFATVRLLSQQQTSDYQLRRRSMCHLQT